MRHLSNLKLFNIDLYGLLAVTTIVGLMIFFVVKPLENKRLAIALEQESSYQDAFLAQEKLERLTVTLVKQRKLSNSLSEAEAIFPDNSGIDDVIQKIEFLAKKNHLVLEEITPQDEQIYEKYRTSHLSLFLKGNYPEFCSLLANLHRELPYVRIDELSISTEKSSDQGLCQVSVNLIIFYPK